MGGIAAVGLLSLCEGTLAWVALEHVEDIGWISTRWLVSYCGNHGVDQPHPGIRPKCL